MTDLGITIRPLRAIYAFQYAWSKQTPIARCCCYAVLRLVRDNAILKPFIRVKSL
jgi:hypothetical protein